MNTRTQWKSSHLWFPVCACVLCVYGIFHVQIKLTDKFERRFGRFSRVQNSSNLLFNFYHYHQFDYMCVYVGECSCRDCCHFCYLNEEEQLHPHYFPSKICESYKVFTMFRFPVEINSEINYIWWCVPFDKLHNLYAYLCSEDVLTVVSMDLAQCWTVKMGSIASFENESCDWNLPIVTSIHNVIVLKSNADLTRCMVNSWCNKCCISLGENNNYSLILNKIFIHLSSTWYQISLRYCVRYDINVQRFQAQLNNKHLCSLTVTFVLTQTILYGKENFIHIQLQWQ